MITDHKKIMSWFILENTRTRNQFNNSEAHYTNDYVVFKKLIISDDIQGDEMNALKHEIQMQHRAHTCENVIRFYGITQGI